MKFLLINERHRPRLISLLKQAEKREREDRGYHAFQPLDRLIEEAESIKLPGQYEFADANGNHYGICAWSEEDARRRLAKEKWMEPPFHLILRYCVWPGISGPIHVAKEPDVDEIEDRSRLEAALKERDQMLQDVYTALIELRERGIDHVHHVLTVDLVDYIERCGPAVPAEPDEASYQQFPNDDVPF
jgi:hypothetical protein